MSPGNEGPSGREGGGEDWARQGIWGGGAFTVKKKAPFR